MINAFISNTFKSYKNVLKTIRNTNLPVSEQIFEVHVNLYSLSQFARYNLQDI